MRREQATYDPDLPHTWLAECAGARECAVCRAPATDELHKMPAATERASALLVTEKGS